MSSPNCDFKPNKYNKDDYGILGDFPVTQSSNGWCCTEPNTKTCGSTAQSVGNNYQINCDSNSSPDGCISYAQGYLSAYFLCTNLVTSVQGKIINAFINPFFEATIDPIRRGNWFEGYNNYLSNPNSNIQNKSSSFCSLPSNGSFDSNNFPSKGSFAKP
jgi:hypothetical protein